MSDLNKTWPESGAQEPTNTFGNNGTGGRNQNDTPNGQDLSNSHNPSHPSNGHQLGSSLQGYGASRDNAKNQGNHAAGTGNHKNGLNNHASAASLNSPNNPSLDSKPNIGSSVGGGLNGPANVNPDDLLKAAKNIPHNGEGTNDGNSQNGNTSGDANAPQDAANSAGDTLGDLAGSASGLLGKAANGYTGFVGKASDSLIGVAKKGHVNLKKKTARVLVQVLLASSLGGGFLAIYNSQQQKTLDAGSVCAVQNTGDQNYAGSATTANGTGGDWTHKGTKAYDVALKTANMLKGDGLSGVAIAGILGNIAHECGFDLGAVNQGEAAGHSSLVSAGGAGIGLIQWTGARHTQLVNLAKKMNKPANDINVQLKMLHTDLSNPARWKSAYKTLTPQILNNSSGPRDAAMRFYLSGFEAGEGNSSDPDGTGAKRQNYAETAYSLFNLSNVHGDSEKLASLLGGKVADVANENAATAENANNAECDNGNDSDDTSTNGDILKTAEALDGYFSYGRGVVAKNGNNSSVKSLSDVKKDGVCDCSLYVWTVLKIAGYKVTPAPWTTMPEEVDAKGAHKYLKQIPASQAGPGTVVIANKGDGNGGNGHTGILAEKWHGNSTKVWQEGGSSTVDHVWKAPFGISFGNASPSGPNGGRITTYSLAGGHYLFAKPIKK